MSEIFDFNRQLSESHKYETEDVLLDLKSYFSDLLQLFKAHELNDRRGIDYYLEFPNGKIETVDVKIRYKDYGENSNVIELTSGNKAGWTLDNSKLTDWIFYKWLDTGRSELFHARQLREATNRNIEQWKKVYPTTTQISHHNGKCWSSNSMFVASRDIWKAIYSKYAKGGENEARQ